LRKRTIALAHIAKCRSGHIRRALMVLLQPHDLARMPQRQRPEQNGIYNTKDRRVRPNSKRQGHHCYSHEARSLPQHAKLVAQILKQSFDSFHSHLIAAG
jgi:hypothetical protein